MSSGFSGMIDGAGFSGEGFLSRGHLSRELVTEAFRRMDVVSGVIGNTMSAAQHDADLPRTAQVVPVIAPVPQAVISQPPSEYLEPIQSHDTHVPPTSQNEMFWEAVSGPELDDIRAEVSNPQIDLTDQSYATDALDAMTGDESLAPDAAVADAEALVRAAFTEHAPQYGQDSEPTSQMAAL